MAIMLCLPSTLQLIIPARLSSRIRSGYVSLQHSKSLSVIFIWVCETSI